MADVEDDTIESFVRNHNFPSELVRNGWEQVARYVHEIYRSHMKHRYEPLLKSAERLEREAQDLQRANALLQEQVAQLKPPVAHFRYEMANMGDPTAAAAEAAEHAGLMQADLQASNRPEPARMPGPTAQTKRRLDQVIWPAFLLLGLSLALVILVVSAEDSAATKTLGILLFVFSLFSFLHILRAYSDIGPSRRLLRALFALQTMIAAAVGVENFLKLTGGNVLSTSLVSIYVVLLMLILIIAAMPARA